MPTAFDKQLHSVGRSTVRASVKETVKVSTREQHVTRVDNSGGQAALAPTALGRQSQSVPRGKL